MTIVDIATLGVSAIIRTVREHREWRRDNPGAVAAHLRDRCADLERKRRHATRKGWDRRARNLGERIRAVSEKAEAWERRSREAQ